MDTPADELPPIEPVQATPTLKPTDIRLRGSEKAMKALTKKDLDAFNVALRTSRQTRRKAIAELRKRGITVEIGAEAKKAAPRPHLPPLAPEA
jgi:hypothetical protein